MIHESCEFKKWIPIVADELKEQAHEMMQDLSEEYERLEQEFDQEAEFASDIS